MDNDNYNLFNNMPISEKLARELTPQALAFVGDAVHSLYVRTQIVKIFDAKSNLLHKKTSEQVKASAQSSKIEEILPILTEDEIYIFKRGRNTKTSNIAKNAKLVDYKRATGFEALLGYLFLSGKYNRLQEILKICEEKQNATN